MTIDKDQLAQAKEWAEAAKFYRGLTDNARAAAEIVRDLPDEIVDGDKLARIIFASGDSRAKIGLIRAEFNLAEPAPPVEIRLGAPAMHPDHGEVTICSAFPTPDGEVRVMYGDRFSTDGVSWIWAKVTDLSPVPSATPTEQEECECSPVPPEKWTTHYGAVDPATMTEYEPSCPVHSEHYWDGEKYQLKPISKEEPQVGEAWLIEDDVRGQFVGINREDSMWLIFDGKYAENIYDPVVLRRLVPEQQPRELTTVDDYESAQKGGCDV